MFVLAGGLGTRFKEQTEFRPKPMIEIGNRPILWHIMRWYGRFGFRRFVICSGFRSEVIKDYFLNYAAMNSDFTVALRGHEVRYHDAHHDDNWEVTVAYTGELTLTGARIARAAAKYLGNAEHFAVTYGDGLCNADLTAEFAFHQAHGGIGTVLATNPPSRFGELRMQADRVVEFAEKPELSEILDQWRVFLLPPGVPVLFVARRRLRPGAGAVAPAHRRPAVPCLPASWILGLHGHPARQGAT